MNTPRVRSLASARLARNTDTKETEIIQATVEAITTLIRTILLDWLVIRVKKQAAIRQAMTDAVKSGHTTLEEFLEGIEPLLEERTESTIVALQDAAESTIPPWMREEIKTDDIKDAQSFLGNLVAVLPSWLRVSEKDNRSLETIITEVVALNIQHLKTHQLPLNAILGEAERIEREVRAIEQMARRAGFHSTADEIRKTQSSERFKETMKLLEGLTTAA